MEVQYGMKAAPVSIEQLKDRINKFSILGMNPIIELHLFGGSDIFDKEGLALCIENCESIMQYHPKFIVHFPHQDILGKIFDPFVDDDELVLKLLDFSKNIKANAIVMHRYCCLDRNTTYDEAEQIFNERLKIWAEEAKKINISILVENNGFMWLPMRFKREYTVTPLDHFFPWEIRRFNAFLKAKEIENVFILIDIAHAVLSVNMLRLWYKFAEFRNDTRFSNITMAELRESPTLTVEDFIQAARTPYMHISDSVLFTENDGYPKNIDIYLKSEAFPLGKGNIDFRKVVKSVLRNHNNVTLILEIDPKDGNYNNNEDQFNGIITLKEICKRLADEEEFECHAS